MYVLAYQGHRFQMSQEMISSAMPSSGMAIWMITIHDASDLNENFGKLILLTFLE